MMLRSNIIFSTILSGSLLLAAGCSSDEGLHSPASQEKDPLWLSIQLSGNQLTRGRENTDAELLAAENNISDLTVFLYDEENGKIVAAGVTVKEDLKPIRDDKSLYNALIALYPVEKITRDNKKKYTLYAASDVYNNDYNPLGKVLQAISLGTSNPMPDFKVFYDGKEATYLRVPDANNKMSTAKEDLLTVCFADIDYPKDKPYKVGGEDSKDRETVNLTRVRSRIDYKDGSPADKPANTYPLEVGELMVELNSIQIANVPSDSYLFPHATSTAGVFASPSESKYLYSKIYFNNGKPGFTSLTGESSASDQPRVLSPSQSSRSDFNILFYATENIPEASSATVSNCTALVINATLHPTDKTANTLAYYLDGGLDDKNNHPTLYYFDDGTFQSQPQYFGEGKEPQGPHWYPVEWEEGSDEVKAGYRVTYYRVIRHGGTGMEAPGAIPDEEDGVISPMEYGIVRNHIYQVMISSINRLPHPIDPEDKPEDGRLDLNLEIKHQPWIYHRGAFEIK